MGGGTRKAKEVMHHHHRHREKNNRREPPALSPEPWLVYSHGKQSKLQTFHSLSERRSHVRSIPKMRNRLIFAHCQGWLVLLHTNERDCSLLNPVTMEEVQLPRLPSIKDISHCALSSPPNDECGSANDNCVVMFIEYLYPGIESVFHICKPGDKDWTKQQVEPQQDECWNHRESHLSGFQTLASFNGEFYAVTACCQSLFKFQLMFDNSSSNVSIKLLDLKLRKPDRSWSTMISSSFLVQASPTELMTVELYIHSRQHTRRVEGFQNGVKRVELYRANFREEKWEPMETLPEDTAIFLGSHSDKVVSFKIPTRQGEDLDLDLDLGGGLVRGNMVYFTPTKDGYLYAYDVGERSISVSLPCPKASKSDFFEPDWIVPLGCSSSLIADHPQRDRGLEMLPDIEIASKQIPSWSTDNNDDDGTGSSTVGRHWWYDIPIDFLIDIQSRLFGADRCFFRLTCKTWNSVFSNSTNTSSNDQPVKKHSHRFPILIHRGKDEDLVNLFNPITNVTNILSLDASSSLKGAVIRCSNHGWLLMSQGDWGGRIFFFNPFTNERIDLPSIRYEFDGITFSSPPTSSDCMVIGYTVWPRHVRITSINRGEHEWTQHVVMKGDNIDFKSSFSNPVYHKGLLYFVGRNGDLCIRNFKHSTTKVMNFPPRYRTSVRRSYLLECDGKLLLVFISPMGKFLEVYALNRETMAWKKLLDLEDRMLFLSSTSALLMATNSSEDDKISGLGNKVFLDRFKEKDGVFYSFGTRKFHTFWSGYNSDDWCNTKEYLDCAWIIPTFKMHTKEELQWFENP